MILKPASNQRGSYVSTAILSRFLPEIKDDIMISQTVEILEPVLTDSKLRGESPPLDAGDVEDEKETKGEKIDKWSAK